MTYLKFSKHIVVQNCTLHMGGKMSVENVPYFMSLESSHFSVYILPVKQNYASILLRHNPIII